MAMCTWEQKNHKLCVGTCAEDCWRKKHKKTLMFTEEFFKQLDIRKKPKE